MDSISRYQTLLDDQPENELLHFSLAKALFDARRVPEAALHFRRALEVKPDWMVVAILLAQCALKMGDKTLARQYYEYALPLAIGQKHEGPELEIREALAVLEEMDAAG